MLGKIQILRNKKTAVTSILLVGGFVFQVHVVISSDKGKITG